MEAGRVLDDRYEVRDRIAAGATSDVFEGLEIASGEVVAIKAVSLERAGWRAEVRDRFTQEARLLAILRSENLVRVRGHGETEDGFLYLVLDRLEGETLAARIARAPRLGWREATAVALAIARGLAVLHERGVVHRDLKPANVILHRDGGGVVPKIIDLGISKARAAADPILFVTLTATGQVLGTPEYMSHEQAMGERDVDARTDVWALGVLLYEMITGEPPFRGANVNAVLAAIRRGAPRRVSEVAKGTPAVIADLVDRCLARDRSARPRDGAEIVAAIEAAVAIADRRPRAHLAGAVVFGAALLATVAWLSMRAPPQAVPLALPLPRPLASVSGAAPSPLPPPTSASSAPVEAPRPAARPRPVTRVNDAGF